MDFFMCMPFVYQTNYALLSLNMEFRRLSLLDYCFIVETPLKKTTLQNKI